MSTGSQISCFDSYIYNIDTDPFKGVVNKLFYCSYRFGKPEILKSYVLLLADYEKNSVHTNHCAIKMLHRLSVELGFVGMMFQASLFRVFQKIVLSPLAKTERYQVCVSLDNC